MRRERVDLDDGLDSGMLNEKNLRRDVTIWGRADKEVRSKHGALPDECRRYFIIRCLIDSQVKDVVKTTEAAIDAAEIQTADDVRVQPRPLVQYSAGRRKLNWELRKYLYQNLYYNPLVHEPNVRAVKRLGDLFRYFMENGGEIVTREMLLRDVWQMNFDPQTNVVDVNVGRLRRKLEEGFDKPALETIWGSGYRLLDGR